MDPPVSVDFSAERPAAVDLEVRWIHGQPRGSRHTDPPLQVHWVDPHTAILRQSKQLTYEAPFLYLFFGNQAALLLDTGAVSDPSVMPLAATVERLVVEWLHDHAMDGRTERSGYRLVVAHTHGHSDHVTGDDQFATGAHDTVVGRSVDDVTEFFGFTEWPTEVVAFDLGGRVLEITGCPGHHEASIAVYDPWTGFLLTGDTVYPGRLYVNDITSFVQSLNRLVELCEQREVSAVMGCHIEMTRTPRLDYPIGTKYQPAEPRLDLTVQQLRAVRDAAEAVEARRGVHVFDDFVIFNGRCVTGVVRQLGRAWYGRLRSLVDPTGDQLGPSA